MTLRPPALPGPWPSSPFLAPSDGTHRQRLAASGPACAAWPVHLGAGPPESTKILGLFADGTLQTHLKRTYDQIPSASARLRVGAAGGAARGGCLGREGKEAAAERQERPGAVGCEGRAGAVTSSCPALRSCTAAPGRCAAAPCRPAGPGPCGLGVAGRRQRRPCRRPLQKGGKGRRAFVTVGAALRSLRRRFP